MGGSQGGGELPGVGLAPARSGTATEAVAPQALGNEEATLQMAFGSRLELRDGAPPPLMPAKAGILQAVRALL